MFKKADIFLYIIILVIGLVSTYYIASLGTPGSSVRITVDGELYGTYPLSVDNTIVINQDEAQNIIVISGGKVSMADSNCPNKTCVNHSPIGNAGETIVCLPHKVLIEIIGGDEYDGISS
jgi:hypothetical protein